MWRLFADENFNGDIVRALLLIQHDLDIVRAQDVGLSGREDAEVLAWAARENRIVLTHDRATLPDFAFERVAAGQAMPGVFIVSDRLPIGSAIQEVLLMVECSEQSEWSDRAVHVPL